MILQAEEAGLRASQLGGHNFHPSPGGWKLISMSPGPLGKFAADHGAEPMQEGRARDCEAAAPLLCEDTCLRHSISRSPLSSPLQRPQQAASPPGKGVFMPFSERADVLRESRENHFAPRHNCGSGNPATALLSMKAQSQCPDTSGIFHPLERARASCNVGPIDAPVSPRAEVQGWVLHVLCDCLRSILQCWWGVINSCVLSGFV